MLKDTLHLKAPGNWINDPNGFIYYKGKYHLFYQHFPYAPVWGTMHWGHAVSDDLVHWEHLPIAVFPTKEYDQNGIFSGSALEKDGELLLYYSAVKYLSVDENNIHCAEGDDYVTSQAMIRSYDGFHFDNWKDKKEIIPVSRVEEIAHSKHTRDPKVWEEDGMYYMILGSTIAEKAGRVVFYRSSDAVHWEYVNQYRGGRYGRILECPDLFKIGNDRVFMGSPMYILDDGKEYMHNALCALAEFEPKTCDLSLPGKYQFVDYGLDLYAVQSNVDADGRRVMIGWMRMPCEVQADDRSDWNGMLAQPRVVEVEDGHIYFKVHPAVDSYMSKVLKDDEMLDFTKPYRIQTRLTPHEFVDIGGYRIYIEEDLLKADRSKVFKHYKNHRLTSDTPKLEGRYELDIFVNGNIIEIFANGGRYVLSNIVYDLRHQLSGKIDKIMVAAELL